MKAYFSASVHGRSTYGEQYKRIVDTLKKLGYDVFAEHVMETDAEGIDRQSNQEIRDVYKNLITRIKKSDLVVAEVSTPSVSVGHEITEAINLNKPVILLHSDGGNRAMLLEGMLDAKVQNISYGKDNLIGLLEVAIEEAKKSIDVRFNFFVSPKILNYLDWIAQKRMIPRSVFLRNLIEREMKKDKEFKE
ncbi:MAG: nucleoside 2-deoxyribosyltransferase [Candidatus Shapirobacteria bacterium]